MERTSDIIGHARQREQLLHDLSSGNIAHAYLFAGPPHIGKATIARWFGGEILTRGLRGTEKATALTQIDKLLHPDFLSLDKLWIEDISEDMDAIAKSTNIPQEHRRKGDRVMRTDTIGIDDVRVLQEKLYETGLGSHRCCFIRSIERLQDEAANALLKILEEPPPGRVFLCTTEHTGQIMPTVVSRMRVVHMRRLPEAELLPLLREANDDDRRFLLHVSQGAPGTLLSLRDDPDLLRKERLIHGRALQFWSAMQPLERFKALEPVHERSPEADLFLLHLALALRESTGAGKADLERALSGLMRDLETNVHRQLAAQKFALEVDALALSKA
jgi:hypothetical protein